MPKDRTIFIITFAAITLLLFHKGVSISADNTTAMEPPVDVTTQNEALITVDEDMPEGAEGVINAPEEAGPALPLTPMPELIEVEQEEPYKPAPDIPAAKEGPEETGSTSLDDDKRFTSTRGMILVQEGCFIMGNSMDDSFWEEIPPHKVCLDSFFLDVREVSQGAFTKAMGLSRNPARFEGETLPVESVDWYEAARYCTIQGKRLPTEAEWEYASRSEGVDQIWAGTDSLEGLRAFAWMKLNSSGSTHEPGALKPNAIGLYDMSGNVREWVSDWFDDDYYSDSALNGPQGPVSGSDKVLRGGSWDDLPRYIRVTYRLRLSPEFKNSRNGFRCAMSTRIPNK